MKKTRHAAKQLILILLSGLSTTAYAQPATLEMYAGAGNPTGNGWTTSQAITLQKNTNNPAGNMIGPYSPLVTVTYALSNQQYTSIEGNPGVPGSVFGGDNVNTDNIIDGVPLFQPMNAIGNSSSSIFTACASCTVNTGIDVTTNRAVYIFNSTDALLNSTAPYNKVPVNSRMQYADITITFSQPVTNPVMHLAGLGGYFNFADGNNKYYTLGYSTEFELLTPGITLNKLSGSNNLGVASGVIKNTSTWYGANTSGGTIGPVTRYAAGGSIALQGINITSVTFRIYVKGDGGRVEDVNGNTTTATPGNQVLWSIPANYVPNPTATSSTWNGVIGDALLMGFSVEAPAALPVLFGPMNATIRNNTLQVNWQSLTEENNDHYDIESSVDGKTFTKIGEVKSKAGSGNSTATLDYSFSANGIGGVLSMSSSMLAFLALGLGLIRRKLKVAFAFAVIGSGLFLAGCAKNGNELHNGNAGKLYIRIAQVDIDGTRAYSKVITAIQE